jgi:uncharacterized protein YgbK (DUF1537 family)
MYFWAKSILNHNHYYISKHTLKNNGFKHHSFIQVVHKSILKWWEKQTKKKFKSKLNIFIN